MTRISSLLIGAGLIALQGCSSAVVTENVGESQGALTCTDTPRSSETCANAKAWGFCGQSWFAGYCQITCNVCSASSGTGGATSTGNSSSNLNGATLTITSSNNTQYCATVTMPNNLSSATPQWQAALDLSTSTVTSSSGANFSANTGKVGVTANSGASISPGSTASFNWCANIPNASVRPTLLGWDFILNVYANCQTQQGVAPTKAALAVAMAKELGRWKPDLDLYQSGTNSVSLTSTGLGRCSNGCANTKALLGQSSAPSAWTGGLVDPTNYGAELWNGLGRHMAHMQNIAWNYASKTPPDHKLTYIAGPINAGVGACGPHYVFQVDNPDGSAMAADKVANMINWLCFFGVPGNDNYNCGTPNSYIGFFQTNGYGCPSGRTCIAIDPTDGDNGTVSSTSAGSAPTYPLNRVYDPSGTLLGTACITTKGALGALISKCSIVPATCGYDYCSP